MTIMAILYLDFIFVFLIQMFSMLNDHVMGIRFERKTEQRRQAVLAQLSVDSETLLSK